MSCLCPDVFVVTFTNIVRTSKAVQRGKTQDTVPISPDDDVSVIFLKVPSSALASTPPSIPDPISRAYPRRPFVIDD